MRLNRRMLLLALSTLATPALPLRALAASAPPAPPPPPPDDTYGFSSTLRAEGVGGPVARDLSSWIKTLKVLGEAPLLTADTPAGGPAFRLTVLSARKPAVCLHVTWSEDRRLATAMISTGDGLGVPGQRTKTVRRDFAMPSATALLELADARETFWDAAPLPPDWDAIQKLADCPTCPVIEPEGDQVLLEGRVGARRHLLVRVAPQADSLAARFEAMVTPPPPVITPPPQHPPKRPPKRARPVKRRPARRPPQRPTPAAAPLRPAR
jgi:hypothetical protein